MTHHRPKKKPADILLAAGVLVLNILFWGGGVATALGYSFGKPMLYAAFLSVLVIGWGGPLLLLTFKTKEIANKSGPLVAAKAVCEVVFMIFTWVGGIAITILLFQTCNEFASYDNGNSAIYWLKFGIAFSVFMCPIAFTGLVFRQTISMRLNEYQCHLISQFPDEVFDSVPYPRVDTPHHDPTGISIRDRFLVDAIKFSSNGFTSATLGSLNDGTTDNQ